MSQSFKFLFIYFGVSIFYFSILISQLYFYLIKCQFFLFFYFSVSTLFLFNQILELLIFVKSSVS